MSVSYLIRHCLSPNRFHPSPAPVITIFAIFAASDTLLIPPPLPQLPLPSSIHASITVTSFTTVYSSLNLKGGSTYSKWTCTRCYSHSQHSHISPVKSLHWLKVEQRIQYRIISITHNLLNITEPKYRHKLINIKPPSKTRSSDHLCLCLPSVSIRLKFADGPFLNSSPRLWNSLPIYLRSFTPDTHTTPPQSSALLLPTLAEHSLFLVISFFRALNPTLHSFLPSIISLLCRVSLLLSRPASFNQYSSRTNANKHLSIRRHLRVLVSRGYIKLYFTYLKYVH